MTNLKSLAEFFDSKIFRIPDYQRGYAWKKDQLVDFWDDLVNIQENKYHYTGLISLKEIEDFEKISPEDAWLLETEYKPYHIVDGQQRLTTISILMHQLIKFCSSVPENQNLSDDEIVLMYQTLASIKSKYIMKEKLPHKLVTTYLFGYESDNPSSEYLLHEIFDKPFAGTLRETYYTQNLGFAKEFFDECLLRLYTHSGYSAIEQLFSKLTSKLKFNIHIIEDEYDVFVAFETMNNRGKSLTNLELLKNRLIYLTTLFKNDDFGELEKIVLRKKINAAWKEVYYQLGRKKSKPLSDDEFLKAHWIIYYTYSRRKGDDYKDYLLRKFSPKNIFDDDTLAVNALFDGEYKESTELLPSEIDSYVSSLNETAKFWFYTFIPSESDMGDDVKLWLEKLDRVDMSYFRPLITVALIREKDENQLLELLRSIERFIFVCFRMGGYQSSYFSSKVNTFTREYYHGFRTTNEVSELLTNRTNSTIPYAIDGFANKMNKHFVDGNGFYSWRGLKYMLFEYEMKLAEGTSISKLEWDPFVNTKKGKESIEHIFPQTPSNYYWSNHYRMYNDQEKKILSGSLGNLLVLSQSVNSSLQNDCFEDKKNPKRKDRMGYRDGSHSEIEVSHNEEWTANEILARGLKLMKFIQDRWNIQFENEEYMIKLLHLGFVNDQREVSAELDEQEFERKKEARLNTFEYIRRIVFSYLSKADEKGVVYFNESDCFRSFVRFTTPALNATFPKLEEKISPWKTNQSAYYELRILKSAIKFQIAFGYRGNVRDVFYNKASEFMNKMNIDYDSYNESSSYIVGKFDVNIGLGDISGELDNDTEYLFEKLDALMKEVL